MRFSKSGNSRGMLKTAIKPALLLVLVAIADTKVRVDAKAELPKIIHKIKERFAVIGFPKKRL